MTKRDVFFLWSSKWHFWLSSWPKHLKFWAVCTFEAQCMVSNQKCSNRHADVAVTGVTSAEGRFEGQWSGVKPVWNCGHVLGCAAGFLALTVPLWCFSGHHIFFWGFRIPNGQDMHVVGRRSMPWVQGWRMRWKAEGVYLLFLICGKHKHIFCYLRLP